jgi:N,N'-diacetyllegionaminate synthase
VRQAADVFASVWRRMGVAPGLAALHCVTSYPVPEEEANLSAIGPLAEAIGAVPGYSDHTLGIEAAVLSVAAGARIVEKHFTLDKNSSAFRDHQLSADPGDLAAMVQRIRQAERLLGSGVKRLTACEEAVEPLVRRSLALARDKRAGEILEASDITWVRPGGGLAPGAEAPLLGRTMIRDVAAFEMLQPDMVED